MAHRGLAVHGRAIRWFFDAWHAEQTKNISNSGLERLGSDRSSVEGQVGYCSQKLDESFACQGLRQNKWRWRQVEREIFLGLFARLGLSRLRKQTLVLLSGTYREAHLENALLRFRDWMQDLPFASMWAVQKLKEGWRSSEHWTWHGKSGFGWLGSRQQRRSGS